MSPPDEDTPKWAAARGAFARMWAALKRWYGSDGGKKAVAATRRGLHKGGETLKRAYEPSDPLAQTEADADEPLPKAPEKDTQYGAAAYGAAVTHIISRPDGIRARAQVSATISAASAAALAGFGGLSGLSERHWGLRALVAIAVMAWLWSLRRYLQAIAYSLKRASGAALKDEVEISALLGSFLSYARQIRFAVSRGTAATHVAIVLTLVAATALTIESILSSPERAMTLSLHEKAPPAIAPVCDKRFAAKVTRKLKARLDPKHLQLDLVPIRLAPKRCGAEAVTVHVRRGWILAASEAG